MPSCPPRLNATRTGERKRSTKRQSSLPPHISKLYSTARWTKRSRAQRNREPRCEACLKQGRVTLAAVADHIVPATDEESFWTGELQSLCGPCHNAKRQAESQGKVWRPKMGCDASGMPMDPQHGWNR